MLKIEVDGHTIHLDQETCDWLQNNGYPPKLYIREQIDRVEIGGKADRGVYIDVLPPAPIPEPKVVPIETAPTSSNTDFVLGIGGRIILIQEVKNNLPDVYNDSGKYVIGSQADLDDSGKINVDFSRKRLTMDEAVSLLWKWGHERIAYIHGRSKYTFMQQIYLKDVFCYYIGDGMAGNYYWCNGIEPNKITKAERHANSAWAYITEAQFIEGIEKLGYKNPFK